MKMYYIRINRYNRDKDMYTYDDHYIIVAEDFDDLTEEVSSILGTNDEWHHNSIDQIEGNGIFLARTVENLIKKSK